MSKLVEGIKDRMVTAAREAAPAVVDAAQKAATAAAEKVAEAVADAKNAAGETSVASEPVTAAEPVAAAHAPEGAIFNPENARGNLHLGIDVGSTTVKLAVLNDDNQIVYAKYQRHHTDVRACARDYCRERAYSCTVDFGKSPGYLGGSEPIFPSSTLLVIFARFDDFIIILRHMRILLLLP